MCVPVLGVTSVPVLFFWSVRMWTDRGRSESKKYKCMSILFGNNCIFAYINYLKKDYVEEYIICSAGGCCTDRMQ